jgi:WD40 repeat protein
MEFNQALAIVNRAVNHKIARQLTEAEIALLFGAWNNLTYDLLATRTGYSLNYLQRDVGPKFWKLLSDTLDRQVNKTNLRGIITHLDEPIPSLGTNRQTIVDWGEAIDVSTFHGRLAELELLTQWIIADRSRTIALVGMGGMGKSALAAQVTRQLQGEFEYVIWRSLRNAPSLETLLSELVPFVSNQQDVQPKPERLLYWLKYHRCLVILDNQDTLLQPGDSRSESLRQGAGLYQADFANYGDLFQLLGEANHQSCILLTSREKSAEIATLEDENGGVRSLCLKGSWDASLFLIHAQKLTGNQDEKHRLCEFYSCSPLAIKMVAATIKSVFDGDISAFLRSETLVFNNIRRLLERQFDRLSALEKTIMYWLAIEREWTTIEELQADIVPPVSRASLLESLESLTWRSAIEQQGGKYTQQPVVMEYFTDCLIQQLVEEILSLNLTIFHHYALIKTTVLDYIRESQNRLILSPLIDRLQQSLPNFSRFEQHLQKVLQALRDRPTADLSYGVGNFINLCLQSNIDLSRFDFSHLNIRHAYLQGAILRNVNFQGAHFDRSVFTQIFGSSWIKFSPNGQYFAIGNTNGELQIWQIATMQIVTTISAHPGWTWAIAWSPDSTLLASSCVDLTVGVWDVRTGQCLQVLSGFTTWIYMIVWSPDGRRIAAGGQEPSIRIWERDTGNCRILAAEPDNWVPSLAWLDGGNLLAGCYRDGSIRCWDVARGECFHHILAHQDAILSLALHPQGKLLASSSLDKTVKLWDWQTAECLQTSPTTGINDCVWRMEWSPDGERLAGGSQDCTVRLWDRSLQCVRVLQGHKNWVWTVSWSPDGEKLASASHDRTVKFWHPRTGECLKTLTGYSDSTWSMGWSRDGIRLLTSSTNHNITLWNSHTGECLKVLQGHRKEVWMSVWSPDERLIASASADATIRIWDAQSGECVQVLRGHYDMVWSVAWSPDGKQVISGGDDRTIRLWDVDSGQCLLNLQGHNDDVSSFVWFPQTRRIASASIDGTIRFWDLTTGVCDGAIVVYSPVYTIALSPDGNILASGDYSGFIKLWNPQTGDTIQTLFGHTGHVYSIAWSKDGKLLASISADLTGRIWDMTTGECLHVISGQNWGSAIAWSPDNSQIAIAFSEQPIRVWDVRTRELVRIFESEPPYGGMNIAGVTGIGETQKSNLIALGAIGDRLRT